MIHGQPEFDIFAKPVVSADGVSVLYDGYAEFSEGDEIFTYSYVNGAGFLSTSRGAEQNVQCLSSSTLPFNDILPALNDATSIPSASIGDETIECSSDIILKTSFGGTNFAICSSGESGFTAFSSDFDIDVEYLDAVRVPALSHEVSCEVVVKPSSVTPTTLALLTGEAIPTSSTRKLETAGHMAMEASSCKCKSTPRPCVVFHGIGIRNEIEELQDTPKKASGRMGNMNDHAPCCSEVKLSETSDVDLGIIKDTVVATHSMGGLVMSMALATGKCSFGEGASWVALSSPMMGSMASDYFQDFCNDEISAFATDLLEFFGQCPMPVSRQSLMYYKEKYASKELNAAYKLAQEAYRGNVSAAMCIARERRPRGVSELRKGLDKAKFGKSYMDKFYKPELNHADTVFLTGDGYFKDSQKPVKWFECLL
ncbi:hypothetical protein PR003_g29241 [Phytophthora rubi]|uniref:Uncharacterized protein n=1 Tax=Phytophthora rubi TaxID=129364 RepID=A0A6A4BT99_9STRA|nr:hypothetical protein PR003_g29241 [Phytophthora rubi]